MDLELREVTRMRKTAEIWKEVPMEMRPKIRYWLPAAAMVEEDLRAEVADIAARGFGGVELVVLATTPPDIAGSEDGWGTENWDKMVDIIEDEAEKQGLSVDIAIGPGWPIASPVVETIDDPAVLCELVYGETELTGDTVYSGPLPERRIVRNEGTPVLVAACAYQELEGKVLVKESYHDLMEYVDGQNLLNVSLPAITEGSWKIFAFYRQPAGQKVNARKNYVVDHLSREGAQACEKYWDKVFETHTYRNMESFFCDSLEYEVALDWTPSFPDIFEERRGYSLLPYLPFIGIRPTYPETDVPGYRLENECESEQIGRDYLETLTQCYCENHLLELERIAGKYGKTVRYQVAYNKPFEAERSAFYVSVPENEALGRPSLDYMKIMAAAAHLGKKERYSFECAAEFGNSYGQSYEDLMWWVKRAAMAGMNAQVMHGACYGGRYNGCCAAEGQIAGVQWPGFEGFGKYVSNYWNRTPSTDDARGVMDTIARMNTVFRKKAKVDCAIFRDSYINPGFAGEFCLYADNGALSNHGYSYEFVSEELLKLPVSRVNNHLLDKDGPAYKCLIVPQQQSVSKGFLQEVKRLAEEGLPVIWQGEKPVNAKFYAEADTAEDRQDWQDMLERVWADPSIVHVDLLDQVPGILECLGISPDVVFEGKSDLMALSRLDAATNIRYYGIYSYNRVVFQPDQPNADEAAVSAIYRKGTTKGSYQRPGSSSRRTELVRLHGEGKVTSLDPFSGKEKSLSFIPDGKGYMEGVISLEEDELLILSVKPVENTFAVNFEDLKLIPFEPNTEDEKSFLRSGFHEAHGRSMDLRGKKLRPWRELSPELEHFAGKGIYSGEFILPEIGEDCSYILNLGDAGDTFAVTVNGSDADFPDQVMKRVDITELVREGKNSITVTVVSNLYNALFYEGITTFGLPVVYLPRDYGIWETEDKKICVKMI